MSIREKLNKNPGITAGAILAVIVIIVCYFAFGSSGGAPIPTNSAAKAFFTIDDGKTTFVDDFNKTAPFDKDGKQAVQAVVYSCDGKKEVVYLERYTKEAKAKREQALAAKKQFVMDNPDQGIEVKAPGAKDWIKRSDPKAAKIMTPNCNNNMELVEP